MGAIVVALGLVWSGLKMLSPEATVSLRSTITLAVLAACAYGDFVTATLVPLASILEDSLKKEPPSASILPLRRFDLASANFYSGSGVQARNVGQRLELVVGQTVCVRAGERIPVDGVVLKGVSNRCCSDDGESKLQTVEAGSEVFAGTQNMQGNSLLRYKFRRRLCSGTNRWLDGRGSVE